LSRKLLSVLTRKNVTVGRLNRAVLVCATTLLAIIVVGCEHEAERPLNVLLISVDTLRPDHLGCYGYGKETSPNIDRLGTEGVLFRSAISSSSWTLPAHMSLFTSLYESVHGVNDNWLRLDDKRVTLAERLRDAGYTTAGFYTGPYLHPSFGFDQGFDLYEGCMEYQSSFPELLGGAGNADEYDEVFERLRDPERGQKPQEQRLQEEIDLRSHEDQTSSLLTGRALTWLETNRESQFLLFLHYFDAHYDFLPPPSYAEMFRGPGPRIGELDHGFISNPQISATMPEAHLRYVISQYDGEIRWVDHNIGLVLEKLEELELRDRTIIVLTSDHGEEFFEHGDKGHQKTLYDEVVKIPLVLSCPSLLPRGEILESQVRIIDIFPTLISLLGLDPPAEILGRNLVPLIRREGQERDLPALSELLYRRDDGTKGILRSLRFRDKKIIADVERGKFDFFDLREDPKELAPRRPPFSEGDLQRDDLHNRLVELSELMMMHERGLEKSAGGGEQEVDEEIRRRLISLGYLEE